MSGHIANNDNEGEGSSQADKALIAAPLLDDFNPTVMKLTHELLSTKFEKYQLEELNHKLKETIC